MVDEVVDESQRLLFVRVNEAGDTSDENVLDLVCAVPEHGRRYEIEVVRSVVAYIAIVITLGLGCSLFVYCLALCPSLWMYIALVPVIIAFAALLVLVKLDCSFPSNLQCNQTSLSFAWKGKDEKFSKPIYWDSIIGASIVNVGEKESYPFLVLNVQMDRYNFIDRAILNYQSMSLWNHWYPSRELSQIFNVDVLSLAFPLHSLTLETDKLRILSFLKSKVPSALLSDNLLTLAETKGTPTYTQLWLDDMQSFRRSRTGALEPDTVLHENKYLIEGLLATGGQARIYRGKNVLTELPVVLKEFVLPTNAGAEVRNHSFASIKNEANFLSSLDHPGIVRFLDQFVEDHRAYLVLEFIEGDTLRNLVKARGPLAEEMVLKICRSICEICSYLHNQTPSVVHRDLAPDNLILTPAGDVRLIDFSVAQHFEADRTKTVCGKHNYMAPEQFRGSPTTQSDLYALGGTLYFLLTGDDPTPLSCSTISAKYAVSEGTRQLVSRLTRLNAADRYQSADDVLVDLVDLSKAPLHS